MELNISELDNMNSYQSFDYNTFEQEENYDKCSKTVKQCNETEDTCETHIFWTCK